MAHDHDHDHDHRAAPHAAPRSTPSAPAGHSAGHSHDHGHRHDHSGAGAGRLQLTLVLTAGWMVVEAIAGWWTGSLALLADAGHMLSDVGALLIAIFAMRIALRPPDARRTYGWKRAEVLGALINGATLVGIGGAIAVEAVDRWRHPQDVDGPMMLAVAAGGLAVNVTAMFILSGGRNAGLNQRAAWLHVMSDALGSVGAMVAGLAVWLANWRMADPIASVVIAGLVIRASWSLLRDALDVLMESAPANLDVDAIRAALSAEPDVLGVHDLHVWVLTPGEVAMSGHVVSDRPDSALLVRLCALLRDRYGIAHATLQLEPPGFDEAEMHP